MNDMLFLHGALASGAQGEWIRSCFPDYNLHCPDLPGHGRNTGDLYRMEYFAEAVLDYCKQHHLLKLPVFGYSMGGYLALYLAGKYPDLFSHVITLGTKLAWTEAVAASEVRMLQPELMLEKVPAFAAQLERLHGTKWKEVVKGTAELISNLGTKPLLDVACFSSLETPVLLMVGDRDKMVGMDETIDAYKQLRQARIAVLPATSHPLEKVKAGVLNAIVTDFIYS